MEENDSNKEVNHKEVTDKVLNNTVITDKVIDDKMVTNEEVSDEVISDTVADDKEVTDEVVDNKAVIDEMVSNKEIIDEVVKDNEVNDEVVNEKDITDKVVANEEVRDKDKKVVHSNESTPQIRKSKRIQMKSQRKYVTPRELIKKRRSNNKLDPIIGQIKSDSNESESLTRTPVSAKSSKKRSLSKESVPQKKCIELTGDSTSKIVDRRLLTTIPTKEGEYSVGDLIWTKVMGYPFWPCMVSVDPISGLYSKITGSSYKAGHIYHVQYFGPKALRGWTSVGQVIQFEGRDKFYEKLEALKDNSPKAQLPKIVAKFAIKPSLKKEWDQSVAEAEEASKMEREDRVQALTFEYTLSKAHLRRKSETFIEGEVDLKRKKLNSSPEDIYDFDDDADAVNISESTPGLMWRKRVQKGDFTIYVERHYQSIEKENPGADRTQIEDMLQRRWDLLGEDLRALYTDRKFAQCNDIEIAVTPNTAVTPQVYTTPKSKISQKTKAKRNSIKIEKQNESNESDSEGNLVIAETPVKKTPNKKNIKSPNKTTPQTLNTSPKKVLNSIKKPDLKGSQNKKSVSKTVRHKKSIENVCEENGVIEKPVPQNNEQSLVNFGIDYLDEFASSEDTSSTSEPEAIDGVKSGFDRFCVLCNESEGTDLLCCSGECFQMFHKKCTKYEGTDSLFKCEECDSGKHLCFVCKNLEDGQQKKTQKCADLKCGKFYHSSCLEKGFPVKYNDQKDSFVCPLHFCLNCHIESQNDKEFRPSRRRLVKCISCPTAYHLGDYCIAAGTLQVSQNYVICPDHRQNKKNDRHVNVNYCFSCLTGGQLICCESCPAAFHSSCLDYTLDAEQNFYCTDCTSRKPLHYGDVVWVKLGFYRWWPGKISHPKAVPDNVMKLSHGVGEFPVFFFGSHDYFWVHKGRVFQYMEGDNKVVAANSSGKKSSKSLLKTFKLATEEAAEQFQNWQESKFAIRKAMVVNKPPPYIHIRSNKAVGPKVQMTNSDESQISFCECKLKNDLTCNDENCINRVLMVECDPKLCRAGDQCKNQRFKKREYVLTKPFKTDIAGWGLRALQDIKKGQFVIEYVGELIDEEECQRRLKSAAENNESNFYFLTIDKDKIIDAGPKGNLARFMNHSCQPNCETQKWMVNGATRVGLFAICDIPSGTELTFNYNLDCRGNEKTRCVCRQTNCSGFLGVRPKTDENHNKKTAANGQNNGRKKKKKQERKSTVIVSEDNCFSCGEGGDLIMCDRKGCPKSYHLECLKLNQIPKGKWECPRHFCDTCGKSATALCSFCPNSVCRTHADPSKLTQLPDGGLMCSEHTEQEINGLLMETEIKSNDEDIETLREEPNESNARIRTGSEHKSSSILETSSDDIMPSKKSQNKCNESLIDL